MPLAGVLYLITLALAFRSLSGSLLPLFAVGQGLIWTFGVIAFRAQPLNIVSNILPCMLLINGVSNSIHVLTRYSEEAAARDLPPRCRPQHDSPDVGGLPGCVQHGGHRVLRLEDGQFARAAGIRHASRDGTVVSVRDGDPDARLAVAVFSARRPFRKSRVWQWLSSRPGPRRATPIVRWRWATVGGFFAIAAVSLWCARTVEVNSSTLETYDENHPAIQTLHSLEEHLSGLLPLEISLHADKPGLFYRPDIFRKVGELQQFARRAEGRALRAVLHRLLQRDQQPLRARTRSCRRSCRASMQKASAASNGAAIFSEKSPRKCGITNSCRPTTRTRGSCSRFATSARATRWCWSTRSKQKMAELFPEGSGITYRADRRRVRERARAHADDSRAVVFDSDGGVRDLRLDRRSVPLAADRPDHHSAQCHSAGCDVWIHGVAAVRFECRERDRVYDQSGNRRRQYDPLHPAVPRRIRPRSRTWIGRPGKRSSAKDSRCASRPS